MVVQFESLLDRLRVSDVSFVIVGGVAAVLHGSARVTFDLDIVYERTPENLRRIVTALSPFTPSLRGAPAGLPFQFDAETLRRGLNFTLATTDGAIDLLGEINGVGGYAAALERSDVAEIFGGTFRYLDLNSLIESKRAAGRPKDIEAIAELEAIRDERERIE